MIEIRCRFHEPGRAVAHDGLIRFHADGSVVRLGPSACSTRIEQLDISDRVGNIPRRIGFDDGVTAETGDNDGVDRALAWRAAASPGASGRGRFAAGGLISRLESRWRWVIASVLLAVLLVFVLFDRGLPAAARWIADDLPPSVRAPLGERTLAALDRAFFADSELPPAKRADLRERARALARIAGLDTPLHLEFRSAEALGANAFALPGGYIVVTDALVRLAESPEEVIAVIAHEIGHLHARHGLRKLLQNTAVAVLVIAATGDVSWLATTLPSTLLSASYSRAFEREADDLAMHYLGRAGIDRHHFVRILERLQAAHGETGLGFLSTHPSTEARIESLSHGRSLRMREGAGLKPAPTIPEGPGRS